jgi:hypothetical protein
MMEPTRVACINWTGKTFTAKIQRNRWEENIKIDIRDLCYEAERWNLLMFVSNDGLWY